MSWSHADPYPRPKSRRACGCHGESALSGGLVVAGVCMHIVRYASRGIDHGRGWNVRHPTRQSDTRLQSIQTKGLRIGEHICLAPVSDPGADLNRDGVGVRMDHHS